MAIETPESSNYSRYLDLLKAAVSGVFLEDPAVIRLPGTDKTETRFVAGFRAVGKDIPMTALTMIGTQRLDRLQRCIETVLADDVPGDFLEAGVWRGGAVILMKAVLAAHGVCDRAVWAADSFAGMPTPDLAAHPIDEEWNSFAGKLVVPDARVRANLQRYSLLDDRVHFLKGWFRDTLPAAPIEQLAVLRMDGDLYESTTDILNALYHRVSPGGFVIVDDYMWKSCRRAVHDFRERHGIDEPIIVEPDQSAYWRVRREAAAGSSALRADRC